MGKSYIAYISLLGTNKAPCKRSLSLRKRLPNQKPPRFSRRHPSEHITLHEFKDPGVKSMLFGSRIYDYHTPLHGLHGMHAEVLKRGYHSIVSHVNFASKNGSKSEFSLFIRLLITAFPTYMLSVLSFTNFLAARERG